MENHNSRRRATWYISLAQQVQPTLASSKNYRFACQAVDLCWSWIERHDVCGKTLLDLFHDDDDYGVDPAMSVEHDPVMWNAWGCISLALGYTSFCAYEDEGCPLPETLELAATEEIIDEFMGYYHGVVGDSQVPELLAVFLRDLPDDRLTRSVVCAKLGELVNSSTTGQARTHRLTDSLYPGSSTTAPNKGV